MSEKSENDEKDGKKRRNSLLTIDDDSKVDNRLSGWLFLRARFSKKWKKRWFLLEKTSLRYGTSETVSKLFGRISLDGARIREADKDGKEFAFCVEPKAGHRVYYIQSEDEMNRTKWMEAMCFAKFSSHRTNEDEDALSLCSIS